MKAVLLTAIVVLTASSALACNYQSGDGLTVTVHENSTLTIQSGGESMDCSIGQTEFQTMKVVTCPGFVGDLYMIPSEMGATFPDIIYMPPNALYWRCD